MEILSCATCADHPVTSRVRRDETEAVPPLLKKEGSKFLPLAGGKNSPPGLATPYPSFAFSKTNKAQYIVYF